MRHDIRHWLYGVSGARYQVLSGYDGQLLRGLDFRTLNWGHPQ